ncbi:MAG: pilus assembly protein PilP [Amphritea sp.]
MMILNSLFRLSVVILTVLAVNGCVWIEDTVDLRRFVTSEKQKRAAQVEPLPEFKPYHSFVYEGASLRSPFRPLVILTGIESDGSTDLIGQDNGLKPDFEREKEYLEGFSLDNLKMVGTIGKNDSSDLWVLIRDGQGEVHRVTTGRYMGLDFGRIVAVNNGYVELLEIVSNGRGGWMKRPRSVVMD